MPHLQDVLHNGCPAVSHSKMENRLVVGILEGTGQNVIFSAEGLHQIVQFSPEWPHVDIALDVQILDCLVLRQRCDGLLQKQSKIQNR